ncbi:hypothetical protein BGZ70_007899 [Mortierella alpina]|uniref:Peptidase A1 domain-containing protein n=1 Tax=Mortierella alpina TaxID=64518 RepID=A0A9P6J4Z4_MORAP|nr:hypothetical protein BGZ70_007899 [Mortierella alpina]
MTAILFVVLAIVVVASAASIVSKDKRSVTTGGVVTLPLKRNLKSASLDFTRPIQRRQEGAGLPASLQNHGTIFSIQVTIGSPGDNFQLLVDTGSADLWLPSTECNSQLCGNSKFDIAKSNTFQTVYEDEPYEIQYGDGSSATYDLCKDTVIIHGITATDQFLGLAFNVSSSSSSQPEVGEKPPNDEPPKDNEIPVGLLGMAFQSISASKSPTFMDTAFQQEQISQNIFSLYLPPVDGNDEAAIRDGEITLGGINLDRYTGIMTYAPLTNKTFWVFNVTGVTLGDAAIGVDGRKDGSTDGGGGGGRKSLDAIMDSGTTAIVLGDNDVKEFYSKSTDATAFLEKYWTFPCTSSHEIVITLASGSRLSVPKDQASLGATDPNSDRCVSAIVGGGTDGEVLLGLSFMASHYVVFDKDNSRLGIASATHS